MDYEETPDAALTQREQADQIAMQAMFAQYNAEERRRWALERSLQLIHALGGKYEDAERQAERFERFASTGAFGAAQ